MGGNPAGDQEEYLKKLDYQEYAAADRIQLLEVLISRGLYSQAMSVIEESGYEGIRPESLLRLTSRMLTKCEMAEDEELLALASDVYRMGKYDEVILKYLMDYRLDHWMNCCQCGKVLMALIWIPMNWKKSFWDF